MGALLVAWDDEQAERLPDIAANAAANGYARTTIVDSATVYDLEPHLGPGALAGLLVPDEHIICPFTTAARLRHRGGRSTASELRRSSPVLALEPAGDGHVLRTPDGRAQRTVRGQRRRPARRRDRPALGHDTFTVTPRRGELIVFDKLARPLVSRTVLPVPTARPRACS